MSITSSSRDFNADWLHTVAHDLKTPINSVRGCILVVQELGSLNERQEEFIGRALNGLQRMEHLVNRLLDISWVDTEARLDRTEVSLPELIEEVIDPLRDIAGQSQVEIRVSLDSTIETIIADARRLGQVIDNLVSNAIKYNHQGGTVAVDISQTSDAVLFRVQDTGIGIAEEDQGQIFERFFRAKEGVRRKIEGTGLGLAITQAIVQRHGGRIWFESVPDEGTTFFFALPLRVDDIEGDDSSDEMASPRGEGPEGRLAHRAALASEERDVVDDDLQETREYTQVDSNSDDR